jgi:hypothetical protein
MTIHVAYINVEGKWLTWMLRHLWVESNEVKALKMWIDSFPEHSSLEALKEYFIPIVSGKKKFTGWASPDGFGIANDKQKFWDPDQSGKGNKNFPLLDNWEDVILLKKARMFVSELHLRAFRLNRQYPTIFTGKVLDWLHSVEENHTENSIRKEVNKYWTEIRNLSNQFCSEINLEMLPVDDIPLKEGPTFRDKKNLMSLQYCYKAYENMISFLLPIKVHFDNKYGSNTVYVFSDEEIRQICGIDAESDKLMSEGIKERNLNMPFFGTINPKSKNQIDLALTSLGVNVDEYINQRIEDSERTSIEFEDIKKTKWQSGYIDLEGRFYGCSNFNHINFADDLCEKFGFEIKENDSFYKTDGQIVLDKKGFIKVSSNRFFWNTKKITQEQKTAIHDYMVGKNMKNALFNTTLPQYQKSFRQMFEHEVDAE